jgi:hypothetical protein
MLHIEYLLPILAFWHTITTEIRKYKEKPDVVNNMVSTIHCILYITQYKFNFDTNYTIHVSTGYYIYDLLHLLCVIYTDTRPLRQRFLQHNTMYVVHHIIGIYLLYESLFQSNIEPFMFSYNLAEMSNIPMYLSNHIRREYPTHKRVMSVSRFIQFLWYSYFRVICLTQFIFDYQDHILEYSYFSVSCFMVLYIMGIVWSCMLLKKNIANYLSLNHKTIE